MVHSQLRSVNYINFCCYNFSPKGFSLFCFQQHGSCCFLNCPVFPFRITILLRSIGCTVLPFYTILFTKNFELGQNKFTTIVKSKTLDFMATLILYFSLEKFELLKCFRLGIKKRYPDHSSIIIDKQHKIYITLKSLNSCWFAQVCMYQFQWLRSKMILFWFETIPCSLPILI